MGVLDLFSKRKRAALKAGQADVYQYTTLPDAFRIQVIHIWATAVHPEAFIVESNRLVTGRAWQVLGEAIARECGVFELGKGHSYFGDFQTFFLKADVDTALDMIELSFGAIDVELRWAYYRGDILGRAAQSPDDAIQELNARFREHAIGYQYEAGQIVRVDEQFVHAEVVKPALALLYEEGFTGASQEFLCAHQHYRRGEFSAAMQEALKAFESTLKTICARKKWPFDPAKDTASKLLEIVFAKKLVPDFLQSEFSALKATLEAGLPTTRNKLAGHGQGATPRDIPDYLAAYALHLAATNILLLVQAYRATR